MRNKSIAIFLCLAAIVSLWNILRSRSSDLARSSAQTRLQAMDSVSKIQTLEKNDPASTVRNRQMQPTKMTDSAPRNRNLNSGISPLASRVPASGGQADETAISKLGRPLKPRSFFEASSEMKKPIGELVSNSQFQNQGRTLRPLKIHAISKDSFSSSMGNIVGERCEKSYGGHARLQRGQDTQNDL